MTPICLNDWFEANKPKVGLFWEKAAYKQIEFFRHLVLAVCLNEHQSSLEELDSARPVVIGEHTSKSIKLPVVEFRSKNGIIFTIRDNFLNYKISVSSPFPVEVDFFDLFNPKPNECLHPVYFEGFPPHKIFGSFSENNKQFSAHLLLKEEVYLLIWIIVRTLADKE